MCPKGWPETVTPAPGAITDVNLIQYLGVACGPANPLDTDPVDRAARLLGIVYGSAGQILQLVPADGLAPGNSLEVAGFNFVYNGATWDMMREGSVAGSILSDPVDRAARLLGVVYGSQAQQLQQVAATFELITQDTGLNTNPERWLHENHWDSGVELVINAAAAVNLGAAVGAGVTRRIREITVRNVAQANTVITLSDAGGNRLSFDVPAQSTRTWSSQDGREFAAASQAQIASSAGAVGSEAYITATGVEA